MVSMYFEHCTGAQTTSSGVPPLPAPTTGSKVQLVDEPLAGPMLPLAGVAPPWAWAVSGALSSGAARIRPTATANAPRRPPDRSVPVMPVLRERLVVSSLRTFHRRD